MTNAPPTPDDLQICSLTPITSQAHRAPTKPRPMSIIARLAQLTLDIFGCRGGSQVSEFRPIDKISTLVSNATSLVLSPPTSDSNNDSASPTAAAVANAGGFDYPNPDADLQGLFDLMGDSEMGWPATLAVFNEDPSNLAAGEWPL